MKNTKEMILSLTIKRQFVKEDIHKISYEEVNLVENISMAASQREAALSRKERIAKEIERLQNEDKDIDKYISGIDEKLEAYGSIRYTEEFLELLIQEELLKSKRESLIRLKDEVMRGEASVTTILALVDLDPQLRLFISKQHEGSRIGRLFNNIVRMGGER